ncbi:hypothetical protein TNIN_308001 [Trichonephila inaurata madagascariensis]|uniref:Uncharacterized protein n=1 Tax=Trichonephila inaurata madagascariensis TaxID=2747483 RepID=A0A8X6YLM9_9ARAC|nr:hypothetical protein TNIN_308001 [Trichonephila inaurata madagascariensis]
MISETVEDREGRREYQRFMAIWKDKENAAYCYNPSIDYKSDASYILGPMSFTCQFCSAMKFKDKVPADEHSRRFNEPTTSEVEVIMAGDQHGKRDIIPKNR